jgi:hypothetical protein
MSFARYGGRLPCVDIFVCTADPQSEPPSLVISTILSLMAYDYPAEKLSVYLSDDGGSVLTFYAMWEASSFAKHWIPFCKRYNIEPRSPAAYFSDSDGLQDLCTPKEWSFIKVNMYSKHLFVNICNQMATEQAWIGNTWLNYILIIQYLGCTTYSKCSRCGIATDDVVPFFRQDMYDEMTVRIDTAVMSGKIPEEIKENHKGFDEWNLEISSKDHQPIVQVTFLTFKLE